MFKKIFVALISVVFVLGISNLSFAMSCCGNSGHCEHSAMLETKSTSEKSVNVGNKICPVSGEKIKEKLKATYEYEGKIYNFCCASCIDDFKNYPEKYIKKVDEELNPHSEAKK